MSRVLYRPHRGGLDQAMAECREFNSITALLDFVAYEYNTFFDKCADISKFSLSFYCHDDRINWDTFAIHDPEGYVCGWCAFNDDAQMEWKHD